MKDVRGTAFDQWDPRLWEGHIPVSEPPDRSPNDDCPECGGLEWVSIAPDALPEEEGFGQLRPCPSCAERGAEVRALALWTAAQVPPKYANCRFETYDLDLFPTTRLKDAERSQRESATVAARAVGRFSQGKGEPFLTLLGAPGNGKTHLAIGAIWRLTRAETPCLYLPSGVLAERARSGDREALQPFFDRVQTVPVLVLDDVGAEHDTEYLRSVYHGIIDARYRDPKLRTLIIGNMSEEDLIIRLGPRVLDRLVEKATGIAVVIDAESVRERRPTWK